MVVKIKGSHLQLLYKNLIGIAFCYWVCSVANNDEKVKSYRLGNWKDQELEEVLIM